MRHAGWPTSLGTSTSVTTRLNAFVRLVTLDDLFYSIAYSARCFPNGARWSSGAAWTGRADVGPVRPFTASCIGYCRENVMLSVRAAARPKTDRIDIELRKCLVNMAHRHAVRQRRPYGGLAPQTTARSWLMNCERGTADRPLAALPSGSPWQLHRRTERRVGARLSEFYAPLAIPATAEQPGSEAVCLRVGSVPVSVLSCRRASSW
jgi:hypothetical protein